MAQWVESEDPQWWCESSSQTYFHLPTHQYYRLRGDSFETLPSGQGVPRYRAKGAVKCMQGRRPKQEDRHVVLHDLLGPGIEHGCLLSPTNFNLTSTGFFALFDGHQGVQASEFCSKRLHVKILELLGKLPFDAGGKLPFDAGAVTKSDSPSSDGPGQGDKEASGCKEFAPCEVQRSGGERVTKRIRTSNSVPLVTAEENFSEGSATKFFPSSKHENEADASSVKELKGGIPPAACSDGHHCAASGSDAGESGHNDGTLSEAPTCRERAPQLAYEASESPKSVSAESFENSTCKTESAGETEPSKGLWASSSGEGTICLEQGSEVWTTQHQKDSAVLRCLREAHEEVDQAFLKKYRVQQDGCTAISALKLGDTVYISCVGDSRAVLGQADSVSGKLVAEALSEDQKPGRADERQRIIDRGGQVLKVGGVYRVAAADYETRLKRIKQSMAFQGAASEKFPCALAVSRAFGDRELKKDSLITAIPEFRILHLQARHKFIVLACDGVWDVMSNQEVIDIVGSFGPNSEEAAASAVVTKAFQKGSQDNLTALVVAFTETNG